MEGYAARAIQSALNSESTFCKFLSANDSGATGGHQAGILVSKSAKDILFDRELDEPIIKRYVEIKWQDDFTTESCFTYYKSKNELRITKFGRGFSLLTPDQTGALFVFTKQSNEHYSGFFLETEEDIEEFLDTFNISSTETNRLVDADLVKPEVQIQAEITSFIASLTTDFPASEEMAAEARKLYGMQFPRQDYIFTNPDGSIIGWIEKEYSLLRSIEQERYGQIIRNGFTSVDDFMAMAKTVQNRRKSRAGKSLEHHLAAIFEQNGIKFTAQGRTEGNKKPDFLFPSEQAYHDADFPVDKLILLAAKTTCKDRWRQVLNEADRLRDKTKYLCTLQQGISPAQMDEMQAENIVLVVPKEYHSSYPKDRRDRIWTIDRFVQYVKETEGIL